MHPVERVWLNFTVEKCSFMAGGAMQDAMPLGNFSLIHTEEGNPVLCHFVALQNLVHESKLETEWNWWAIDVISDTTCDHTSYMDIN